MATEKINGLTREYVRSEVKHTGTDVATLRTLPTHWAFLVEAGEPVDADWKLGSWDPAGSKAVSRCLIGPGGTYEIPDGTYFCWVRVSGATEVPVRMVGKLKVGA